MEQRGNIAWNIDKRERIQGVILKATDIIYLQV